MRLLMKDPYKSEYILGSVMLGEVFPFMKPVWQMVISYYNWAVCGSGLHFGH